jgi:tRNA dimethylallyltransferase
LTQLDPVAAARMEPGNRRRIVRALEVIDLTGRKFSSFGPGIGEYATPAIDVTMYGIAFESPVLAERIARRFDAMREHGLVSEVQGLAGEPLSRTAREAIGYREALAYLAGELPLADAFDAAVRRTRRFARRQRVWFGRDPRVQWVDGTQAIDALASEVATAWSAPVEMGAVAS